MLDAFKSCHRKGFHEFIAQRATSESSIHLHAGAALAKAFEVARISHWGPEHLPAEYSILKATRAMMQHYGLIEPPEIGTQGNKSFLNCFYALDSYFQHYGWETDTVQPLIKEDGMPAVEFRFCEPLPVLHPDTGEPLLYAGRFDMFGISREYGGALYGVDEKTTTALGSTWSKQWDLRSQFIGYTWAARKNGYPILGVIARGIGMLKGSTTHLQAIVQIPNWKVDRWLEITCKKLEAIKLAWVQGDFQPVFSDACNAYGGCDYKQLCDSRNEESFYHMYRKRVWDPTALDPTHTAEVKHIPFFAEVG